MMGDRWVQFEVGCSCWLITVADFTNSAVTLSRSLVFAAPWRAFILSHVESTSMTSAARTTLASRDFNQGQVRPLKAQGDAPSRPAKEKGRVEGISGSR